MRQIILLPRRSSSQTRAEVIDLATGTKAITTETGTISLAWLSRGTTILRIRRIGYLSKRQPVEVSPTDTVSITVVLQPMTQELPVVITNAKAEVDTISRLRLNGFYDRRKSTAAPTSAFVTADQMRKWGVVYLGDVQAHNGRGICGDVYVDGILIVGGVWLGPGDRGAKPHFEIDEIADVESYYGSEVPAQYNGTRAPTQSAFTARSNGRRPCAATLIWRR